MSSELTAVIRTRISSCQTYAVTGFRASISLGFVASLLSCAPGDVKAGLGPNENDPAVIVVTPTQESVSPGEAVLLHASGLNASGQPVAVEMDWTATGGTLLTLTDSTAQFSAALAGSYTVRGRGRKPPHPTDSTTIVVTQPVSPIVSIAVSPSSATLATGAVQAFVASASRQDGTTLVPSVSWSATGGTITQSGIYTAGTTAGNFRVVAVQQGGSLADTSAVTVTVAPPVLQAVILTPPSASLSPGGTQQFSVAGQWSDGSSAAPAVTYSATGGTITTGGLYTAGSTAGAFRVIAKQQGGSLADTSAVTVAATPPVLQAVILTPASANLNTGATQQFSVSGQWSDGSSTAPAVTYTATGGSITTGGLYTAGTTAGTFRVIAKQQGGTLADTAAVTLTAPTGSANECATPQAGWIWCDDFESDRTASYFEYDNAGGSFVRVTGVGEGGSTGMRARFSAGQTSAGSLKLALGRTPQPYFRPVDAGTSNYRELFWRFYLRNQPGWTGGAGDKLTRATIFASSTSWAQAMIGHVWGGAAPDQNYLIVDPASGTDAAGNLVTTTYNDFANLRWLGLVRGNTPIFDSAHVGSWYCVEVHIRLNSAGASDGYMEYWINGGLEARYRGT